MPLFFENLIPSGSELPELKLVVRLLQSGVLGIGVAAIYYLTQRKKRLEAAPLVATLVLLCVLIAMVTLVVGNNVARAFSLAGALAIIRFRTVVDDTRDTAFVIAAVVTGMAVGADAVAVALAGLPVIAVAAWGMSIWGRSIGPTGTRREAGSLAVRLNAGVDAEAILAGPMARLLELHNLREASTARQGTALDLVYSAALKPGVSPALVAVELARIEGVIGVEWKNS